MVPWFQYCTDLWFTGFDPPRSLIPAAAIAPPVTTSDPAAPTIAPQPSATQVPGARQTAAVWNPIPLPSPLQHVPLPKETNTAPVLKPQVSKETNPVPIINPQASQPQPADGDLGSEHQDPSQKGSGSTEPSGQSSIQNDSSGDPKFAGDSNQDASKDPSSPAQNQEVNTSQVATNAAAQHSSQNESPDPGDSTPAEAATRAETTISLAGHAVVVGPSGVHVDGVKVNPNQAPTDISGMAAMNQGNSIVVASQIFHLAASTEQVATIIAGQTVIPIANGVSIHGTSITGTNTAIISGTAVSVHDSHLYFGSKSYPLPTANPASATTLANGVVALPISNAVSIYGTTLTAGAPAATFSGTAVFLDVSNNLVFDGTGQALPHFPQTESQSGQVTTIDSVTLELLSSGISVAGTTLTPGAPAITASGTATLSPGVSGTTVGGTLVSLGSGGNLVIGSKTVVLGVPSGSLGGIIMGGFGSGGPLANSSSPPGSLPSVLSNSTSSSVHIFEGRARCLRSLVPEGLAGFTIAIHLVLYFYKYQ